MRERRCEAVHSVQPAANETGALDVVPVVQL
jgi:hypothetical protein